MASNENLPPNVIKQLAKELKNLNEIPPEGIKVGVNDDNFSVIYADIEGPAGTPYENGLFRMKLILSHDFPLSPPKGYFLTKIFHPNIANNGEICVNALKRDWNPRLGLRHVLMVIRCLLIEPFPESSLNEQAGKMLLDNYEEYARYARLYTGLHAKPKAKLKVGVVSESSLNVDHINTSVCSTEQKTAEHGVAPLQSTSPSSNPSSNAMKGGTSEDQSSLTLRTMDIVAVASVATPSTHKDIGIAKVQPSKKKIDTRKKSLKRL